MNLSSNLFDVVIAGSGFAGLTAALAADVLGLKTIVLEKAHVFGGGSAFSDGIVWVGKDESAAEFVRSLSAGEAEPARLAAFVESAPAALDFLRHNGVPFEVMASPEGRLLQAPAFPGVHGPAGESLIAYTLRAVRERSIKLLSDVRVHRLTSDAGRVTGVRLDDGRSFAARYGVVLATGGYESDPVLTARFEDVPGLVSATPASITGDGLRMGGSIGARVHLVRNNLNLWLGYRHPDAASNTPSSDLTRPHTLVVNRFGRRFANEARPAEVAAALRTFDARTRTFANLPCWLIFDRRLPEQWGFGASLPGSRPNWGVAADTLAELAQRAGIDEAGLEAESVGFVAEPPFYALELQPSISSSAGLAADADGRARNWRGETIPGLYAIGDAAAHDEYGAGYQTGFNLSSAMTFALRAARDLAAKVKLPAALALVVLAVCLAGVRPAARAADADVVRLTFNPGLYDTLPLMVALEKGYFTGAHLDVEVTKISAPHGTLIPSLARGDIDVAPQTLTPAFFNQLGAGFGIKILALMSGSHKGWNDTVWDVVREDVWEAKQIRKPSDLRGKSVPKPIGNAVDFMLVKTLAKGGLTLADVDATHLQGGPTNLLPALLNKEFDALAVGEPLVTQLEKQGLVHRWLSYNDVAPGFQSSFLAASASFAATHRDALQRFVTAYIRACRYIDATGGKWTPELIDILVKWSGQNRDVIAAIPGPAYPGLGEVSTESIDEQEQLWLQLGILKQALPPAELIDGEFAAAARAAR
ncbi:MAG: FAD-dependent oxidoreductase [Candidatus Lustribacter sp.]|jgi:ABC-type nitrate/sulfonate/bicarbonate transport system substrate-binding protein